MTASIEEYLFQLRMEGWCLIEGVIPEDRVETLRDEVVAAHERAIQEYEAWGGSLGFQSGPKGEPGKNVVAYVPSLAAYFGDKRVVGVAQAMLDPHVRIAQTEFKTRPPNDMANFSPFSEKNGGTWVVPRSHRDLRNPRSHLDPRNPPELHDNMDPTRSIPGEMQLSGPAGSVVVLGSRIWHSNASNPSPEPRVTVLARYSPWWINLEFGGRNRAIVPRAVYEAMPDAVKVLYRHRAEGVENSIQRD